MRVTDLDLASFGKLGDLIFGQPDADAVPDDLRVEVLVALPHYPLCQWLGARIDGGSEGIKLLLHGGQIGHFRGGNVPPIFRVTERADLLGALG